MSNPAIDYPGSTQPAWRDEAGGVRLILPPPSVRGERGCAWPVFIAMTVAAIAVLALLAAMLLHFEEIGVGPVGTVVLIAVLVGWAWRYYLRTVRNPDAPPLPTEILIRGDLLQIERIGTERDTDVSWQREEITDVRLSATMDSEGISMVAHPVLHLFLTRRNHLLRVSVMGPTGEIDDVIIETQTGPWVADAEQEIRQRLGL